MVTNQTDDERVHGNGPSPNREKNFGEDPFLPPVT